MTTIEVKKINRSKVYHLIYAERAISKQEIALKLNMGLTTVTQNLKALEEGGWVRRTGYYESTGGRKAQAIEIVRNAETAIGVFILKKKFLLVAVNLYGEVIREHSVEQGFEATEAYYKLLGREVMLFANSVESNPNKISGVGIAIQGVVHKDQTAVAYGKLLALTNFQLSDLAQYIPYPCILEHDSKAAAFAEIWNRADLSDAVVLLLNRNLGSALVIGNEVHRGKNMYSGTMEHLCLEPQGRPCYCGGRGCFEAYCSAESLQREIEMPFEAFFSLVRNGEEKSVAIWESYLSNIALAVRNILTVIDADILLSGFLAPYFTKEDLAWIKDHVKAEPFFAHRELEILPGKFGETAPAIGAALHFVKNSLRALEA